MKSYSADQHSTEYENANPARRSYRSKILGIPLWLLGVLISVIVVIVIVVPIAVVFGRNGRSAPRSEILVPLYVYPSPGAWDPLFEAAEKHPDLNFTAVVNPASGPGPGAEPDGNFTRDIPRLNSYPNVRTVGYVSTSWTNRDIALALEDIGTYSRWRTNAAIPNLGVRGIFLDEAPTTWTAERGEYLETLAAAIRSDAGLEDHPLIIHNPGMIPDQRFMPSCNVSVVFEQTYDTYQNGSFHETISDFRTSSNSDRDGLASVVHSFPASLSSKQESAFVKDLRRVAGSVFLTGLSVEYYHSFWDGWAGFVDDMAAN